MLSYQELTKTLTQNPNCFIDFYLPNGIQIPKHYHITDVGSINRHFIDCGGKIREENYVQVQLWQGKDTNHRLNAKTLLSILKRSSVVLDKLPNLEDSNIFIEYKSQTISQYPISKIQVLGEKITCFTEQLTTQCLAALRYEEELKKGNVSDCCKSSCC